ncbi:hypothetical protein [Streptomyces melanogenes]|uniref:hypothetical protein n=1 Tax=Streptomyces melanogenes TaxID=67326 RepID=UPI00167E82CB|nr:hypothetical protein [Streptomyces melanogenes]GGP95667.1 hypothetical protein GCM10010278_86660 [Streptomyces melanogenes]
MHTERHARSREHPGTQVQDLFAGQLLKDQPLLLVAVDAARLRDEDDGRARRGQHDRCDGRGRDIGDWPRGCGFRLLAVGFGLLIEVAEYCPSWAQSLFQGPR